MKRKKTKEEAPAADSQGAVDADQAVDNDAEDAAKSESPPDPAVALAEAREKYLRAKAEFDNYRKRVQREFGEIREQAKLGTIQEFLPAFDFFQMALDHADQNADVNSLKQGMQMIATEFKRALEGLGVTTIDATGTVFDPDLHEAVAQEASTDVPEGHVISQWKCGFRIGERLVRPAAVVVSAGDVGEEPKEDAANA